MICRRGRPIGHYREKRSKRLVLVIGMPTVSGRAQILDHFTVIDTRSSPPEAYQLLAVGTTLRYAS